VQYAQATDGNAGAGKVIGHVSKLAGTATAIRNGVAVILHNGDNVEKGDVVESGANSTLGITFIDGTVFGLSSNARMVLNEMVYDPNGSNNSSLLSLVAGTITFVAGETAKHGDMKVDTPVATMGIRGTAVLCEIDFLVPGQGTPDAKFQVLIEPDGTTGSFVLYDKTTLLPLAVVDTAGQQITMSNGLVSQTSAQLSPDVLQLISDVLSLKFSDNSSPRIFDHHTDTVIPQSLSPLKLADGAAATPVVVNVGDPVAGRGGNTTGNASSSTKDDPVTLPDPNTHINQPPTAVVSGDAAFTAHTGASHATGIDSVSGTIRFADINANDLPTASTKFVSFKLFDAQHHDITATLTAQQLAQVAAVEAQLVVTPSPGNNNNGSATWTYSVADAAFDFLTAGQTLTLTYDAVVDNNFLTNDQSTGAPFTITISAPSNVEWIHPSSGLWSVGSNWSTGSVPTASEDAIIPAQNIPGGTGLYDVTIEAPAFARNLTLNANDTTGAQVTNDSTLTVGQMLTIFNDGVLNNSGTVTVGKLELFDQTLLQNSGLITLGQGDDFTESITIANSGTIVLAGGTLDVLSRIDNSGGVIQIDHGASLVLKNATIDGGTVDDGPANFLVAGLVPARVDVTGSGMISDAILNGGASGAVEVESGAILTLDNVTANQVSFFDLDISSALRIDKADTLTLSCSLIDAGTVTNNGAIGISEFVQLEGGVAVNGGQLSIANAAATLQIDEIPFDAQNAGDSFSAALNGVDVMNSGTVLVASLPGALPSTLALDDGTTITGGTLTIADGSTLAIASGGATLDGVQVAGVSGAGGNPGSLIDIGATAGGLVLTLDDGTSVTNGTLLIADGSAFDVESSAGATLDGVTVLGVTGITGSTLGTSGGSISTLHGAGLVGIVSIPGSTIEIGADTDSGSILTLDDGSTIMNGTLTIAGGSTLDIESNRGATLDGVMVSGTNDPPNSTIEIGNNTPSGSILTLDDGSTITNGTLTIAGGGTLDVESTSGATLDGVSIFTESMIEVGAATPSGSILTLDGGTLVEGGTLTIAGGSALDVESFSGATLDGVSVFGTNFLTASVIEIGANTASGSTLTLEDGASIQACVLTIASGSALDASIGGATLDGVMVSGANGPTQSMIEIGVSTPSGSILTLDDGTLVTNIALAIADYSALDIESTGGATLAGVAVAGGAGSMIEIGANTDSGSMLVLADATTLANVALTVTGGGTLNVEVASTASTFTGTSTLDNAGTIDSNGAADLSGLSSFTNGGFVEVVSGNLKIGSATGISGTGTFQVDAGTTLEFTSGVSSGQTVTFNSTTGTLKLDQAENFNGVVSGFSTADGTLADSDQIDLADINHHSASFQEQFDAASDTLTVTDGVNTAVIHFTGSVGPLQFVDDGTPVNGVAGTSGTIVFDPPATGQGTGAVIAHDPGPASNTVLAVAPNQMLTGSAAGDTFVFNFAAVGHTTVTDFHPASDTLQFSNSIFANLQAALNATHDDGHGNTVIAIDNHDSITLSGVLKAQLHPADFHLV
jgi:FecR protein